MKIQISVCAKDLPDNEASYRAIITHGTVEVGRQDAEPSKNPSWPKLFTVDNIDPSDELSVSVHSSSTNEKIATASFSVSELQDNKAAGRLVEGGVKICVLASPPQNSRLTFVLAAQNLPDTDFSLGLLKRKQHTDPFFTLHSSTTGKPICRSRVIEDELNPVWEEHACELDALCGGDLDILLRIAVYDKDRGSSVTFLGQARVSVNQMLAASSNPNKFGLFLGTVPSRGHIIIQKATLVPQEYASRQALMALEAAAESLSDLEDVKRNVQVKQQSADEAKSKAEAAQLELAKVEQKADQAAVQQDEAHKKLVDLEQIARKAEQAAVERTISGSLQLLLSATDLPDTDGGLRLRNKTDPIYEVHKSGSDQVVIRSNVVEDDLNPKWEATLVDLEAVCGGDLDAQFLVTVSDKDGGDKKEYLGSIKKSVNEFLQVHASSGIILQNQPKGAMARLFVLEAKLVDFKNLKEEAEACQQSCNDARQSLEVMVEQWKTAQKAVEDCREAAIRASECAQKAQDEAEAAALALEMMQKGSI